MQADYAGHMPLAVPSRNRKVGAKAGNAYEVQSHFAKLRLKQRGKSIQSIRCVGTARGNVYFAAVRAYKSQEIQNTLSVDPVSTLKNPYFRLILACDLDDLGSYPGMDAEFVCDDEFLFQDYHLLGDTGFRNGFILMPQVPPSLST